MPKVDVKLQLPLLMLLVSCSSTDVLRDRLALDPNPCILNLETKEMDCKRPIEDAKNLVCFTPEDLKKILEKVKEK